MKLVYPKDFVRRVKEEYYPKEAYLLLHKALDSGDPDIEGFFKVGASLYLGGMNPQEVITALDKGELEKIRKAAEKAIRRDKLYEEWRRIYYAQGGH